MFHFTKRIEYMFVQKYQETYTFECIRHQLGYLKTLSSSEQSHKPACLWSLKPEDKRHLLVCFIVTFFDRRTNGELGRSLGREQNKFCEKANFFGAIAYLFLICLGILGCGQTSELASVSVQQVNSCTCYADMKQLKYQKSLYINSDSISVLIVYESNYELVLFFFFSIALINVGCINSYLRFISSDAINSIYLKKIF